MNALTAGAHALRHDWTLSEVQDLFALPFNDLLFQAQTVHRAHFDPNEVQVSTLLSIKTGACPEDCKYCPQSARYHTGLETERLMEVEKVLERAREAKANGSSRLRRIRMSETTSVPACRSNVSLGRRHAAEAVITQTSPRGETMYWIGGAGAAKDASEGTDFHAIAQGHVAMTPLQVDLTDHDRLAYWAQTAARLSTGMAGR